MAYSHMVGGAIAYDFTPSGFLTQKLLGQPISYDEAQHFLFLQTAVGLIHLSGIQATIAAGEPPPNTESTFFLRAPSATDGSPRHYVISRSQLSQSVYLHEQQVLFDNAFGSGGSPLTINGILQSRVFDLLDTNARQHVTGGGQDDFIVIGDQPSFAWAQGGNDTIEAGDGDDVIDGGADVDKLKGNIGSDTLYGQTGDDLLFEIGRHGDRNTVDGGDGYDRLLYGNESGTENTAGIVVNGGASGMISPTEIVVGVEFLAATDFNDDIQLIDPGGVGAGGFATTVYGRNGNDIIQGTARRDLISGGNVASSDAADGSDYIYGGKGADALYGGGGDDFVYAGEANVGFVTTDDDANELFGGAGQDALTAWTMLDDKEDRLDGGLDKDTYYVDGVDVVLNFEVGETAYLRTADRSQLAIAVSGGTGTEITFFKGEAPSSGVAGVFRAANNVLASDLTLSDASIDGLAISKIEVVKDTKPILGKLNAQLIAQQWDLAKLELVTEVAAKEILGKLLKPVAKKAFDVAAKPFVDKMASAQGQQLAADYLTKIAETYGKKAATELLFLKTKGGRDFAHWSESWVNSNLKIWLDVEFPGLGSAVKVGELVLKGLLMEMLKQLEIAIQPLFDINSEGRFILKPGQKSFEEEEIIIDLPGGGQLRSINSQTSLKSAVGTDAADDILVSSVSVDQAPAKIEILKLLDTTVTLPANFASSPEAPYLLAGNELNNTLVGNSADNMIAGHAGSDTIYGGNGNDTAVFNGVKADYEIARDVDGSIILRDNRAGEPDGTDRIENIEFLQFADLRVAVSELTSVNTSPVPVDDKVGMSGGQVLVLAAESLLSNDTDPDGDTLTISSVGDAKHGSVSFDQATGFITFTPDLDFEGLAGFTYVVADGHGGTARAAVDVTVNATVPEGRTFQGTKRADVIHGTIGDDIILGREGNDKLYGGSGNDKILGGTGNDWLYGQSGNDVFIFDSKPHAKRNLDKIRDFSVQDDALWLDNAIFKGLGKAGSLGSPIQLAAKAFWKGKAAHDGNDRIIYDKATGALYYDSDGTGHAQKVQIAQLSKNLKVSYKDFFVI